MASLGAAACRMDPPPQTTMLAPATPGQGPGEGRQWPPPLAGPERAEWSLLGEHHQRDPAEDGPGGAGGILRGGRGLEAAYASPELGIRQVAQDGVGAEPRPLQRVAQAG